MTDLTQVPLWELEMHETMLDAKLDKAPAYLRDILTPTQYKYYLYYVYGGLTLADISILFDRDITTICRTISKARLRVLNYLEKTQAVYADTDSVIVKEV